jgi:hypothetical protein
MKYTKIIFLLILMSLVTSPFVIGAEGDDKAKDGEIEIASTSQLRAGIIEALLNYVSADFDDESMENVIIKLKKQGVDIEMMPTVIAGFAPTFTLEAKRIRIIDLMLALSMQCSYTFHFNKTGHIIIRDK